MKSALFSALFDLTVAAFAATPDDGSVLPFLPTPSASVAKPRLQDSVHHRRVEPSRLPAGAPNVLIVLIDDVGFGTPDTFGGFCHTPTLSKLRDEGIPAAFSASETFDIGVDLGSTVSLDYFDRRPFKFNGRIQQVKVELK